jgi:flagellar biogenesis protein FliO
MQGTQIRSAETEMVVSSTSAAANFGQIFSLAVTRLRMVGGSLWRAGRKHKALTVCETAALGDRRFVSVIQFGRQRFLIGSSPGSITLLSVLPDEILNGRNKDQENHKESGEQN